MQRILLFGFSLEIRFNKYFFSPQRREVREERLFFEVLPLTGQL